jgi:hypothetical protein
VPVDRVSDDVVKGALMEPCRTCGAPIPEALIDDYCQACLDQLRATFAEALLENCLAEHWAAMCLSRRRGSKSWRWQGWLRSA